jgi:hypothetical protein
METWACTQGMYPPTLASMGALERLDDPINTPMKSLIDRFKEMHKERAHQEVGAC